MVGKGHRWRKFRLVACHGLACGATAGNYRCGRGTACRPLQEFAALWRALRRKAAATSATTNSSAMFRIVFGGVWCKVLITRPGVHLKVLPGIVSPFGASFFSVRVNPCLTTEKNEPQNRRTGKTGRPLQIQPQHHPPRPAGRQDAGDTPRRQGYLADFESFNRNRGGCTGSQALYLQTPQRKCCASHRKQRIEIQINRD
jgi:hypothetical protein